MVVRLLSEPLRTERLPNGRRQLLGVLSVEVDGRRFNIPDGFITDYSSIPFGFRNLVHWSRVDIAGVVHDWLYKSGIIGRRAADEIWRKIAMAGQHGANGFQAWVGYLGLRVGGWLAWRRHRGND